MLESCPRIVIAGTGSGVGKTSIALALVSALRRRGLRVQPFKVGPDFLDPTYLSRAAGRTCFNLDGWMTGRDYVGGLFAETTSQADIAVIEGVMGLFDGSDPVTAEGSTAEIAAWLDAPVILVVNAHGASRSIAALVKGFATFDPGITIAGVIANRCGSDRHVSWLSESLRAFGLPQMMAGLPRGSLPGLSSRHLGLVTADERMLTDSTLGILAEAIERYGAVDRILEIARSALGISGHVGQAFQLGGAGTDRKVLSTESVRLGLARDEAFHFYYPDNLAALERSGCRLVEFSPIRDHALPDDLDGLYIGGGYPEEYARQLSENGSMLDSIRSFAETRRPMYAECGGLMYLSKGIELRSGERFGLVGLLPAWTRMLERLKSLGYVEVTLTRDSLFGEAGTILRGHEFHYSELVDNPASDPSWDAVYAVRRRRDLLVTSEGFQRGSVLASYVHAHFASDRAATDRFVALCRSAGVAHGRMV